jgi:hypothetical protein
MAVRDPMHLAATRGLAANSLLARARRHQGISEAGNNAGNDVCGMREP